jgi:hypothetical protein
MYNESQYANALSILIALMKEAKLQDLASIRTACDQFSHNVEEN